MSKRNKILSVAVVAVMALSMLGASYFSTKSVVATMHGETNYFVVALGGHTASPVRRISPSNVVDVLEGLGLSGGGSGTNAASMGITNFFRFFAQTNALAGAGTTNLVIDGNQAALVRCVPGANFGLLVTNLIDGQEITVEIKQDATGIRTMAIPNYGNLKFGTDITGMTLSTNAAYIDVMKIKVRNTNALIVGFVRGYTE